MFKILYSLKRTISKEDFGFINTLRSSLQKELCSTLFGVELNIYFIYLISADSSTHTELTA